MAVSSKKDLHEFALEESCCPVCLEEFKEPKSLPNCLHNVCEKCLKSISMTNGKANISSPIICPVCRKKSQLPVGGVSAMPTNRLLVRLVEKTTKSQVKLDSRHSLEGTKRTLQRTKSEFESLEQTYSRLCASKAEISSKADKLISIIKEQEKKLHAEVDRIIEGLDEAWPKAKRKEMSKCLQQFINRLDDIESSAGADTDSNTNRASAVKDFSQAMLIQLEEYNKIFALHGSEGMTCQSRFLYNSMVERFLEETMFGKLTVDAEKSQKETSVINASGSQGDQSASSSQGDQCTSGASLVHPPVSRCESSGLQGSKGATVSFQGVQGASGCSKSGNHERYNPKKFGTVIKTVFTEDAGVNSFTPVGLAVSNSMQEIAVLTKENRVHIFWEEDLSPNWFFNIKYGELYDLAYSADDEIVVVNRENNRLLHYDGEDGTFIRKFVNGGDFQGAFAGVSVDDFGRLIICCSPEDDDWYSDTEASVLVFDENRRFEFSFGEGKLSDPEKALFYNEQFFVNDTEDIKVFDASGRYKCKFGKFKNARGLAINTTDAGSTHVLVCDEETDSIKIFKQNGKFVAQCHTNNRPRSVAVTASGVIAVACEWGECVQFISYPLN